MFGNRNDSSADSDSINNSFCNFKEVRMNNYWENNSYCIPYPQLPVCSLISDCLVLINSLEKQVITCSHLLHPTALLSLSCLNFYTFTSSLFVKHVMCCANVGGV